MSDELIDRLAKDLAPVPRHSVAGRLIRGLAVGAAASFIVVVLTLGFRPDLAAAATRPMFWMKLAYPLALLVAGLPVAAVLARPAGPSARRAALVLAPFLMIAAIALFQLYAAPPAERMPLLMGASAMVCPFRILAFSLAPLVGLIWAVRGLAPTRLRLAGFFIGLAAGAAGAAVYAVACPEEAPPFIAAWYTLGILFSGALGAALGPRVLRW